MIETRFIVGQTAEATFPVANLGKGHWITAVAVDSAGLLSLAAGVQTEGRIKPFGTLRAILLGVQAYKDPELPPLSAATRDAERLAGALKSIAGRFIAKVETQVLPEASTPGLVFDKIREAAHATGPEDRLLLFYAGHGVVNRRGATADQQFMLTFIGTKANDLTHTAMRWSEMTDALAESRGPIVVLLDACHSGLAGSEALATNDDLASALFTRRGGATLILAGSKGRQASLEDQTARTGLFTSAVVKAIRSGAQKGPLNLGELYGVVKSKVVETSSGRQTPWLVRNNLIGEIPLF
ncbi:caspase family protein [Microvirga aerilata]|uniref:Caspase family protein n=1 Tax=Microvirga aerilata TaxID=670292 RepID=A0A937CXW2_9HYPH|nr:caspase family protein [Microvirga aerilata]MBL0406183.1 caspase family protein [Microvirga aerilata]